MDELKKALQSVPDAYDDFVGGMMDFLKDDEERAEEVIEYIKNNPDAQTDDVIDFYDELD